MTQSKHGKYKPGLIDEGYDELAKAIIWQAYKDFKTAYRKLKRKPDDRDAAARVKEVTTFFCGEYFCLLTDLDGPRLLKKIMATLERKDSTQQQLINAVKARLDGRKMIQMTEEEGSGK